MKLYSKGGGKPKLARPSGGGRRLSLSGAASGAKRRLSQLGEKKDDGIPNFRATINDATIFEDPEKRICLERFLM